MDEITSVASEDGLIKAKKSDKEIRQVNSWQKKLLPWMILMPSVLILLFIYLATVQMQRFNELFEMRSESVIEKVMPSATDSALNEKLKSNLDYVRWMTLARMEEKSFDRRYNQGGLLLVSRIFTKYLGFFTGMILVIVGAVFIIGKLQEDKTDLEGEVGGNIKLKLVSSSPGIIFGVLGTILMLSTILEHTEISISDKPLFLNPTNVYINSATPSVTDTASNNTQHQIPLSDADAETKSTK